MPSSSMPENFGAWQGNSAPGRWPLSACARPPRDRLHQPVGGRCGIRRGMRFGIQTAGAWLSRRMPSSQAVRLAIPHDWAQQCCGCRSAQRSGVERLEHTTGFVNRQPSEWGGAPNLDRVYFANRSCIGRVGLEPQARGVRRRPHPVVKQRSAVEHAWTSVQPRAVSSSASDAPTIPHR